MTHEDREELRRRFEEELLHGQGFEPSTDEGPELWFRREEGMLRLYTRLEALRAAKESQGGGGA